MNKLTLIYFLLCAVLANAQQKNQSAALVPKPLYTDPIYNGAADPVVIWNKSEKKWFMFYTNRRANVKNLDGVTWVHGTRIGVATSKDGVNWKYRDTCDIQYRLTDYTHWAPEVIENKGLYHMYLTYVPGVFKDWRHPRYIVHLTSKNMLQWKFESKLELASDRVIDACVFKLPDGKGWRMYYNNEVAGKSIFYADSQDLYHWTNGNNRVVGDRGGEGPKVFFWKDTYWLVVDNWKGLGIYSSKNLVDWKRQEKNILEIPGTGLDDRVIGGHADVVVNNGRAFIYYFTHPGRTPENKGIDTEETRRSSIQLAELEYDNGTITCNRNKPLRLKVSN